MFTCTLGVEVGLGVEGGWMDTLSMYSPRAYIYNYSQSPFTVYLNVTIICRYILLVLNFAFFLGLVKFNDIHCSPPPPNKYLHKLIFLVLEQTTEISNVSTHKFVTLKYIK